MRLYQVKFMVNIIICPESGSRLAWRNGLDWSGYFMRGKAEDDWPDLVNNIISKLSIITFIKLDCSAACGVSQCQYERLSSDLAASGV